MAGKFELIDYDKLRHEIGAKCDRELAIKLSTLANEQITPNLLAIKQKFTRETLDEQIEQVIRENDVPENIKDWLRASLIKESLHLVEQ